MQPSSFYFIRHGETDFNIIHHFSGQQNIDINQTGIEQARAAIKHLKDLNIQTICVSSLKRAQHTANVINEVLQAPMIIIDELKELNWGELEGKPRKDNAYLEQWERGEVSPMGAETFSDFKRRVEQGIEKALTNPGPVLIVSHGLFFRVLRKILDIPYYHIANCAPIHFQAPNENQASWQIFPVS